MSGRLHRSDPILIIRPSNQRGLADRGWLKSRHTFSFAEYHDPAHMGFGSLRVINEDWVQGGTGFGAHPHRDMEIITYVVAGSLVHQDSLGSNALIRPNEIQRMTAGTGIVHSEMSPATNQETHLFQIWIKPERQGLPPSYGQKDFAAQLLSGNPVLVVSKDGRNSSISINQDVDLYITRFKEPNTIKFALKPKRAAWIQTIAGTVTVNGQVLKTGDAASVTDVSTIEIEGAPGAEVMLFDLMAANTPP